MSESALVGHPPANQRDTWIVKGFLASAGFPKKDPSNGLDMSQPPTSNPDQDDRGPAVIAGLAICIVVVVGITTGRIMARYLLKTARLGWDDFFVVIAAMGAVAWLAVAAAMVPLAGAGRHVHSLRYDNLYWYIRFGSIDLSIFFVTVSFAKLSIVCFNWRLTGHTSRTWEWTHKIFFVTVICYLVVSILWSSFRCNPSPAAQDIIVAGQHADTLKCLNLSTMTVTLSALHIAFDWILLSFPAVIVLRANIPWARRLRCIVPLSVGLVSCIGSIMRLRYQLHPLPDLTWSFPRILQWSELDITTAVIATSLPTLYTAIACHLPTRLQKFWGASSKEIYAIETSPTIGTSGITTNTNDSRSSGDFDRRIGSRSGENSVAAAKCIDDERVVHIDLESYPNQNITYGSQASETNLVRKNGHDTAAEP